MFADRYDLANGSTRDVGQIPAGQLLRGRVEVGEPSPGIARHDPASGGNKWFRGA